MSTEKGFDVYSLGYQIVESLSAAREDFEEVGDFYSCKAIDLAADITESFGSLGLVAEDYFDILINSLKADVDSTPSDEGRAGFVRAVEIVSDIRREHV